jgi:hypothetical protein
MAQSFAMYQRQQQPGTVVLANPNASQTGTRIVDYVTAMRTQGRRKNTALAYLIQRRESFESFASMPTPMISTLSTP